MTGGWRGSGTSNGGSAAVPGEDGKYAHPAVVTGFGLVEATLTAALVAVGMTSGAALTAVLAYRLVNFWMILIGGWITMVVLTRFRSHTATSPGSPAAPG